MQKFREPLHKTEWTPQEVSELAQIKRMMELFQGDSVFRERLPQELSALTQEHGFTIDPEEIRVLWDVDLKLKIHHGEIEPEEPTQLMRNYRRWIGERVRWRDGVRAACSPDNPNWKTWRERQMKRAYSELGEGWSKAIIFDTAAIELSKGCSVGCWFCGVDAPKLEDHLHFNEENEKLFKEVMEVLIGFVGIESASAHFLYWASDPLDNPHYEEYCRAFKDVVGVYPLTTTALAVRDVERTRRILNMLMEDQTGVHRFSVLNLKILKKIHAEFSPEELARVELVMLNKESQVVKADAGRFREKAKSKPALRQHEENKIPVDRDLMEEWEGYAGPGSIACVSGLLLNLVERSVKLITPCKASDRWPLGYVVFEEGRFETAQDLKDLIQGWIDKGMKTRLPLSEVVRFRSDLTVKVTDEGFSVFTPFGGGSYKGGKRSAYYKSLGSLIQEGCHEAGTIADRMLEEHGVFHAETYKILDWLFDEALLQDEPDPVAAPENLVQLSSAGSGESVAAPA